MTAKEFLRSLRKTEIEIRALRLQIDKLRGEAQGVKAMTLSDMPKGGKGRGADDAIADIVDLQALCAEKIDALVRERSMASRIIMQIERSELRTVLTLYYFDGMSWDEVAAEMFYSVRQVLRLHGEALVEFESKMRHVTKCHLDL